MLSTGQALNRALFAAFTILTPAIAGSAQQPDGPQIDPPPAVARPAAPPRAPGQKLTVPSGTRLAVLLESKRPGRIKGKGEFRLRLESLILPNGYTVDLLAAPRSADTGGKETTDPEGKVSGSGGKGKDVGTVATTTVTGAGIGAIAGGGKGAGIGAGIGGLAGLGAVLLTRGPEAELPRGTTLDIVIERDLTLDSSYVQFSNTGHAQPITPPPARQQ